MGGLVYGGAIAAASLSAALAATPPAADAGLRHHALETKVTNFYAVFLPRDYDASGKKRYPLCMVLHGSGSTEVNHGRMIAQALDMEGVIFLCPRAPYPKYEVFLEMKQPGFTAWPEYPEEWGGWDSASFPKDEIKEQDPARQYTDWMAQCLADARRRYPIADDRIVVVGHSQGGGFAQRFAGAHPELVKAYAAYAGSFGGGMKDSAAAKAQREGKVVPLLLHCEADSTVKVQETRDLSAHFDRMGVAHAKEIFPGGDHSLSSRPMAAIRKFVYRQCLGKEAPRLKGYLEILDVAAGAQGDSLGLRKGDRLLEYDGKKCGTLDALLAAMQAAKAKTGVTAWVETAGKRRQLNMKAGRIGILTADR